MRRFMYFTAVAFLAALEWGGVAAVTGQPRTGKTTVTLAAAEQAWPRTIVLDPYAERDAARQRRGEKIRRWTGERMTLRELAACPELLDRPRFRYVVSCGPDPRDAELARTFDGLAGLAWDTGDITLIAEEASRYGRAAEDWFKQVATGGQHAGLRFVAISQRLGLIPIDTRAQVSHWVAFARVLPGDFDGLMGGRRAVGDALYQRMLALSKGDAPVTWSLGEPT